MKATTRGHLYDLVSKDPVPALVATYQGSGSLGSAGGCPSFTNKIEELTADSENGFFKIDIGSGKLFTISFCDTEYSTRSFLDQSVEASQPWLRPKRGIMLVKKAGSTEEKATAVEVEVESFVEDILYLRESSLEALRVALQRLSERGTEAHREVIKNLKSALHID